jgi:hypothetical protein
MNKTKYYCVAGIYFCVVCDLILLYILVSTTCEILTGLIFLDYVQVRVRVMLRFAAIYPISIKGEQL